MNTSQLILKLKENNEDYELYPTSDEMFAVMSSYFDNEVVLDIGCGTCNLKKFMRLKEKELADRYNRNEDRQKRNADLRGERYYPRYKSESEFRKIRKYFVMEKSKILLQQLDDETICIGTDFHENTLIDKKVTTIFCNPPYSEFEDWTIKILSEGNYFQTFLIIPQRWKENMKIMKIIEHFDLSYDILGSFDFLNAERAARAKVDVIRFKKRKYLDNYYRYENLKDFDVDAFDNYFNTTFNLDAEKQKEKDANEGSYTYENKLEEQKVKRYHLHSKITKTRVRAKHRSS